MSAALEVRAWRAAKDVAGIAGGVKLARRYSGNVVVTMVYRDRFSDYACRVSSPDGARIVFVGTPGVLTMAVDCKEAFDDTARAAIAFVDDEGFRLEGVEYDEQLTQVAVHGRRRSR